MNAARASLARIRIAWVVAAAASAGCYHSIEPAKPRLLDLAGRYLPGNITVRIENGYAAPELRRLRSDVVHKLDADLRDWSARLVSELDTELERLGVVCQVPDDALDGTSVAPLPLTPQRARLRDGNYPVLRARITDVLAPNPESREGASLSASLESGTGDFTAIYTTGPGLKGFADAFLELKQRMLDDARFLEWLRAAKRT
jgi:hypothetical protein